MRKKQKKDITTMYVIAVSGTVNQIQMAFRGQINSMSNAENRLKFSDRPLFSIGNTGSVSSFHQNPLKRRL